MKILVAAIALLVCNLGFSGQAIIPTFKDLWKSADFVVSARIDDLTPHSNQKDIPDFRGLNYERVIIHFTPEEVFKGDEKSYDFSDPILVDFYTAEIDSKKDFGYIAVFGPEPYLQYATEKEMYLIFLRLDVSGNLVPVDERYFLYLYRKGFY